MGRRPGLSDYLWKEILTTQERINRASDNCNTNPGLNSLRVYTSACIDGGKLLHHLISEVQQLRTVVDQLRTQIYPPS